jgi:hypothetical protein
VGQEVERHAASGTATGSTLQPSGSGVSTLVGRGPIVAHRPLDSCCSISDRSYDSRARWSGEGLSIAPTDAVAAVRCDRGRPMA